MVVYDGEMTYTDHNRRQGVCGFQLHQHNGKHVAICTELVANKGTSVTNAAAVLATQICQQYEILPDDLVFIEHYTPGSYSNKPIDMDESYAQVEFTWSGRCARDPQWKYLDIEGVLALTGEG